MNTHHSLEVVVSAIEDAARDIRLLELRSADGAPLPAFAAGAHIDLHLANGMSRSYSLCNAQGETDRYQVAVARDANSRGGSVFVHDRIKVGDRLSISPPRNNFPLVEDAAHVVLIAGGIGITPMYCMVQRLESLGRSWELWYSCRLRDMCAFRQDLEALEAIRPGRVHLNFDGEPGGTMTDLGAVIADAPADAHFYCCGPNPMLQAFEAAGAAKGRAPNRIHVEYFSAKSEAAVDGGYVVVCAKSDTELAIEPGQTILDAMLDAGIEIEYSCFEGVCGTCECRVIEGVADHRDSVLTGEEKAKGDRIMVCCSGSKSARLVLDI